MADFNNTNLADFSGVWVFCEQRQGELQPTVLELISERNWALTALTRFWFARATCSRPTPPMHTQRFCATPLWLRSRRSC